MEINKQNPLVSIVVITYNSSKFVLETLDSVKSQTYRNIELIISDDASTDQTVKLCKEWLKKNEDNFERTELITSCINKGIVHNYYTAINKCKGKFIAQCAGDDFWTDIYKLEKQVNFLESNIDYGMVHTNADLYWEDSGKTIKNMNDKLNIPEGEIFEELLTRGIFIRPLTVLIRKELIKNYLNDIDPLQWSIEDYPLFLYISKHSKVKYFNESTGLYRKHSNSITQNKDFETRIKLLVGIENIGLFFAKKYNVSEKIIKILLDKYHKVNIEIALYSSNLKLAKSSYNYLRDNHLLNLKYKIFFLGAGNIFIKKFVFSVFNLKNCYRKIIRRL